MREIGSAGLIKGGIVKTITARAFNGHTMIYNVIGRYADGSLKTSQWDAVCSTDCAACAAGDIRPDW